MDPKSHVIPFSSAKTTMTSTTAADIDDCQNYRHIFASSGCILEDTCWPSETKINVQFQSKQDVKSPSSLSETFDNKCAGIGSAGLSTVRRTSNKRSVSRIFSMTSSESVRPTKPICQSSQEIPDSSHPPPLRSPSTGEGGHFQRC